MTFQEFCSKTPQSRTLGSLLLGLGKHPFFEEGSSEEEQYLEKNYHLDRLDSSKDVIGLAAAYLNDTICIGFESEAYWAEIKHKLMVSYDQKVIDTPIILSVSRPTHFESPEMVNWLRKHESIQLLESNLKAEDKPIKLRHDHGMDVLLQFSKRLRKSPFVTKIVNSLPFNPRQKSFIQSVSEDGLIEIILTDTEQGLGIVVQTTGQNQKETEAIAEILKEKYER